MDGDTWLADAPPLVRDVHARARAGDPGAMIGIAGYVAGTGRIEEAVGWLAVAAYEASLPANRLLGAMETVRDVDRSPDHRLAWRWRRSPVEESMVWVWPGVLGPEPSPGDRSFWDPKFLVITPQTDAAAVALARAGSAFSYVAADGRILDEDEYHAGEIYTPNWVSDPLLTEAGPAVEVDTKGACPLPMGRTMVDILVAELDRVRVGALVTCVPDDFSVLDWTLPTDPLSIFEPPDDGHVRAWYATDSRFTAAADGEFREHRTYLTADGSWTTERDAARRFDRPPPNSSPSWCPRSSERTAERRLSFDDRSTDARRCQEDDDRGALRRRWQLVRNRTGGVDHR